MGTYALVSNQPPLAFGDICQADFLHDVCINDETTTVAKLQIDTDGLPLKGFYGAKPRENTGLVVTRGHPVERAIVLSDDCEILKILGLQPGLGNRQNVARGRIWFAPVVDVVNKDLKKQYDGLSTGLNYSRFALEAEDSITVGNQHVPERIGELRFAFRVDAKAVQSALRLPTAEEVIAGGGSNASPAVAPVPNTFVCNRLDQVQRELLLGHWAGDTVRRGMIVSQDNADHYAKLLSQNGVSGSDASAVAQSLFNVSQTAWGFDGSALETAGSALVDHLRPADVTAALETMLEQLRLDVDAALIQVKSLPPLP